MAACRRASSTLGPGWTERAYHPGYRSADFASVYLSEREEEVRTLTDPAARRTIAELGLVLCSYADYRPASGRG